MQKTQFQRLTEVLGSLKVDVTTDDRNLAATKFKVHERTVTNYLNAQGSSSDLTANLITFFKNRIAERDKVIA